MKKNSINFNYSLFNGGNAFSGDGINVSNSFVWDAEIKGQYEKVYSDIARTILVQDSIYPFADNSTLNFGGKLNLLVPFIATPRGLSNMNSDPAGNPYNNSRNIYTATAFILGITTLGRFEYKIDYERRYYQEFNNTSLMGVGIPDFIGKTWTTLLSNQIVPEWDAVTTSVLVNGAEKAIDQNGNIILTDINKFNDGYVAYVSGSTEPFFNVPAVDSSYNDTKSLTPGAHSASNILGVNKATKVDAALVLSFAEAALNNNQDLGLSVDSDVTLIIPAKFRTAINASLNKVGVTQYTEVSSEDKGYAGLNIQKSVVRINENLFYYVPSNRLVPYLGFSDSIDRWTEKQFPGANGNVQIVAIALTKKSAIERQVITNDVQMNLKMTDEKLGLSNISYHKLGGIHALLEERYGIFVLLQGDFSDDQITYNKAAKALQQNITTKHFNTNGSPITGAAGGDVKAAVQSAIQALANSDIDSSKIAVSYVSVTNFPTSTELNGGEALCEVTYSIPAKSGVTGVVEYSSAKTVVRIKTS